MDAISCLAPPPPPALLPGAAIARALHSSMSDSSSSAPSPLLDADFEFACSAGGGGGGFASAPPPVLVADSAPPSPAPAGRARLAPAGGRAGKRRSRASKRAPTTYISTDAANFRLMVQHITGVQADPAPDGVLPAASVLLATEGDVPGGAAFGNPLILPSGDAAAAAAALQQQQQQPCFPTLDSWSVMYESSELLSSLN